MGKQYESCNREIAVVVARPLRSWPQMGFWEMPETNGPDKTGVSVVCRKSSCNKGDRNRTNC